MPQSGWYRGNYLVPEQEGLLRDFCYAPGAGAAHRVPEQAKHSIDKKRSERNEKETAKGT